MAPLTQRSMEATKASFTTIFCDQETECASALEGHVRVHQSSAPPFTLGLPSGLARSQQLYMMQRFLNIPATPSYDDSKGVGDGLVLYRVVANFGGRSWCNTFTLRLRAQRAWNTQQFSEGKPHQVLSDPSMYALSGRFRAGVGRSTALKAFGELGSLRGLNELRRKFMRSRDPNAAAASNAPAPAPALSSDEIPRGRVALQSKFFPWHVAHADLSHRERYQTSEGYEDGPSHASVTIASRGPQFLNYRFGVRQWLDETLPEFERAPGGGARPPPRSEALAGVSIEQQATLWRGERRAPPPGKRPGGYAALPQRPNVTIGGLVGALARMPLVDSAGGWTKNETELRHVVSGTLHASVGSYLRPMLDYTAIDVRYDAGAMQPHRPLADAKPEGETSWVEKLISRGGKATLESEIVTLSATQQLLGPLKLRAEVRCTPKALGAAMGSAWTGFKGGGGGGGGGEVAAEGDDAAATGATGGFGAAWTACKGEMKGAELIYGVDCPLPPALGAARLVAWYNVNRREAMAEMRLFDL